jgi:flagellar basal-body rod modification protein FlgD
MASLGFDAESGRQQFLQLLVTQLQHQDPLEPVGQQEFLQQLAQFSVVEGVEQLNSNFGELLKLQQLTQGVGLVGQVVSFSDELTGEELIGRVSEVRVEDGQFVLMVGDYEVTLDEVQSIIAEDLLPA